MEKENKKGTSVKIINFKVDEYLPESKFNVNKGYIMWGDKHSYPKYLVDMYNRNNPIHSAIINKKVSLIAGKGFEQAQSPELNEFIKKNKLNKEVKKATLDYQLTNSFCFEIIWNREGTAITSIKHLPVANVVIGIPNEDMNYEHFWYSNNWEESRKEMYKPVAIRKFNPLVKQGKSLYYYSEYNPTSEIYPVEDYRTSLISIENSYRISEFHLQEADESYNMSMMINFGTGIPSEEEQDEFFKQFQNKFKGNKGQKLIITYSDGKEQAPELTPINLNDSSDRFLDLNEMLKEKIIIGGGIPPQLLISIPGKLGGDSDRQELLNDFNITYITPRQENMEEVINHILASGGFTEELRLKSAIEENNEEINNNDNVKG